MDSSWPQHPGLSFSPGASPPGKFRKETTMDRDQPSSPSATPANPLQPIMEVLRGEDPDTVCARHQISRAALDRRLEEYHKSQRQVRRRTN